MACNNYVEQILNRTIEGSYKLLLKMKLIYFAIFIYFWEPGCEKYAIFSYAWETNVQKFLLTFQFWWEQLSLKGIRLGPVLNSKNLFQRGRCHRLAKI